tara:strand:+ start:616678 stop:617442 length:765 start_codon:yes stop_codon:yes gene_type:complete
MNPVLVLDVMRFELARSMTIGRIAIWFALVTFPVTLISILRMKVPIDPIEPIGFAVYFLVPEVVCLLGLLLWATPAIATEIEGQTWIYLAMRQSGRVTVLMGKYLTAVAWSLSAALVAATLCVVIVNAPESLRMWWVMCALATLSCFAHAAIFLLIGVIFHRRTMVMAVVYTLGIEYGLSFVPAVANKITVNYHLRGLLADWMKWDEIRTQAETLYGIELASTHLAALGLYTVTLLCVSIIRLTTAEFPTQQDG